MCWNAAWNGSEDYEESWNGRMAVIMEKLQRNIVFLENLKKMNNRILIGVMELFFRQ
jgi:hypothetical protein